MVPVVKRGLGERNTARNREDEPLNAVDRRKQSEASRGEHGQGRNDKILALYPVGDESDHDDPHRLGRLHHETRKRLDEAQFRAR